jgi:hypothetical protein
MLVTRRYTLTHPVANLVLPDDDGNVYFGYSCVFDDVHNLLIVGDTTKNHDFGSGVVYCGAAYVFNRSTGLCIQEILPSHPVDQTDGCAFGAAFAHNGGEWLVITGTGSAFLGVVGVAYFLKWDGSQYRHVRRLVGSGATAATTFGYNCDADGALCIISEPGRGTNRGALHVFREAADDWSEDVAALTLAPDVQTGQSFGEGLAVNGTLVAAGAPFFHGDYADQGRAYVLRDAGVGSPLALVDTLLCPASPSNAVQFGTAIDLEDDCCAIGWNDYPGSGTQEGAIVTFRLDAGLWPYGQTLTLPTPSAGTSGSNLGWGFSGGHGSICLSGNYLLGGAPGWHSPIGPGEPDWSTMWGCAFLWQLNPVSDEYEPVPVNPDGSYAIYPHALGWHGQSIAISAATNEIAIGGPEEYADWATYWALPEGPPPAYTYGGTVRLYELLMAGHPLYNKSFEDPGTGPGEATWWVQSFAGDASTLAGFTHADGYTYGFEDFEGYWDNENAQTEFAIDDLISALFEKGAHQFDSFEFSWKEPAAGGAAPFNNQSVFVFDADMHTRCTFYVATRDQEDLEAGWGASPYNENSIYDIDDGTVTAASFDSGIPEDVEDFEEEWTFIAGEGNEDSRTTIADPYDPAYHTKALFDWAGISVEIFDNWTETLPI